MPRQKIRHTLAFLLRRHRRIFFLLLAGLPLLWHIVLLQLPQGTENIQLNALENAYAQRQTLNQLLGRSIEPMEDILILGFDHTFRAEDYQDLMPSEPALSLLARGGKVEPDHPINYDRRLFGLILDRLASAGARLVVFDWFFDGPGPFGEEGNLFFAEQIRRHSNQVLLANLLQFQQRDNLNIVTIRDPYEKLLPDEEDDALLGFVNVWPDSHGCISRHIPAENTLALSSPQLAARKPPPDVFSLANAAAMRLGHPAPTGSTSEIINFIGPGGSFNKISIQDIFIPSEWKNRFADGAFFKDKIILVGPYSEIHYKDAFRTPVGAMLGVEIQANCLNNALRGNWIRESFAGSTSLLWTFFLCGVVWLLFSLPRPGSHFTAARMLLLCLLLLGSWIFLRLYLFAWHNLLFPRFSFFAAVGLAVVFLALDFLRVHSERSWIRHLFGSYLAPSVIKKLLEKEEEPKLGGEQLVLTSFFSDVQNFSFFAEMLPPGKLVALMNEYLGEMSSLLEQHEGTLDKYVGDGIVAMFGAPLASSDHAARACSCALAMQHQMDELHRRWLAQPARWPEAVSHLRMRIGLSTGRAIVGNMGSAQRFNYTMMGDAVNLAARCENGAKLMGAYILATQSTVEAALPLAPRLVFRELDHWRIPGRQTPLIVHELVGWSDAISEQTNSCLRRYQQGFLLYQQQRWAEAREHFLAATAEEIFQPDRDPGVTTNPSLVMAKRCAEFQTSPPSADWDGTFAIGKH